MNIHYVIASREQIPNLLTGSLKHEGIFPADKVYIITTKEMQENAKLLQRFYHKKDIKTEQIDATLGKYKNIKEKIKETLEKNQKENCFLNITGGPKVLALHIFSIFKEPVYYIDATANELNWIRPFKNETPKIDINESNLSLFEYFNAFGFKIMSKGFSEYGHLIEKFVSLLNRNSSISLNKISSDAGNDNLTARKSDLENRELSTFLENEKLIEIRSDKIIIKNNETRKFLNGIWLEEYVFKIVKDLRNEKLNISDCAMNVEVAIDNIQNELDVVAIHNNELLLIECKTGHISADTVYTLNNVANSFGKKTKKILVSCHSAGGYIRKRAEKDGILVIDNIKDIKNLKSILTAFLKGES